jgi:hypothetical protein
VAVGALPALHRTKGQFPLANRKFAWRIRLVAGGTSSPGMRAFEHIILIVIEERRGLESLLVMTPGAIARVFTTPVYVGMAADTRLA